ncbi:MAG: hypothetical protein JSR36_03800 [Proteobacteria bacterium]|nr:hypothetical protein [Pseudomonadota bacterium]
MGRADNLPAGQRIARLLSQSFRRNRLVALLAACALIACSAVYASHGLGDRGHEHEHCDLCVHFSGSAGSPAQVKVAAKPLLVLRAIFLPPPLLLPNRSPVGANLARGPPLRPTGI